MDDLVLLDELSRILRVGVGDLNDAAQRMGVALSVVRMAFHDGVLKGYWKVADDKLFIRATPEWARLRGKAS